MGWISEEVAYSVYENRVRHHECRDWKLSIFEAKCANCIDAPSWFNGGIIGGLEELSFSCGEAVFATTH
jgi:hypothetical protein